jgi:hypothetical protein
MATLFHRRLGFPSLTKDGSNRIERRFRSVPAPTDRTAVADEDLLGRQENRIRQVLNLRVLKTGRAAHGAARGSVGALSNRLLHFLQRD